MSIRIGSSGISYAAIRALHDAEREISRSSARLASGRRINSAADDPAGLAVADGFRAQVASLSRAQLNTADGIGLAQVAQSGLSEIASLLSDARALAVQSSSGALGGQTRAQLDTQLQAIMDDIDAIASNASFGSFNPLNNSGLQVSLAVGTQAGDTITVSGVDADSTAIGLGSTSIATSGNAGTAIGTIDTAISSISAMAARFGIAENRLESRSRLLGNQIEAYSAAESRIRDTDFALESARLTRAQILQESAIAVLGQGRASMRNVLRLLD
jgi:flagellin